MCPHFTKFNIKFKYSVKVYKYQKKAIREVSLNLIILKINYSMSNENKVN